jgi:pyrroline-5-carboxylate reductase
MATKVGIIGLGRLGGALARGLARASDGACEVYAFNRTAAKAEELAKTLPRLRVLRSAGEVLACCDPVFLWMNGEDAAQVLVAEQAIIRKRQPLLVSSTLRVPLAAYTSRSAECLPSVTLPTGRAVTIIAFPPEVSATDRRELRAILERVGSVYEVPSGDLTYYSALTSCGPALYAVMFEMFADTLVQARGFDRETCRRMVRETALSTLLLHDLDGIDAAEIVHRVAHPGGSTIKGVRHLQAHLPKLYEEMLKAMGKW